MLRSQMALSPQSTALRQPQPGDARPQGGGGGGGGLSALLGGAKVRYNRMLDKIRSSDLMFKVSSDFGVDEHNVVFGLGLVAPAAGATATASANAPRDMILRRLICINNLLVGDADFTITSITVEGNAILLGSAVSGAAFFPGNFSMPTFDLPVAGGTPVSVTLVNGSAAGQEFTPTFLID